MNLETVLTILMGLWFCDRVVFLLCLGKVIPMASSQFVGKEWIFRMESIWLRRYLFDSGKFIIWLLVMLFGPGVFGV